MTKEEIYLEKITTRSSNKQSPYLY